MVKFINLETDILTWQCKFNLEAEIGV